VPKEKEEEEEEGVRYVTKTWSVVLLNKKNTYTAI
jgi:hypothetical protein